MVAEEGRPLEAGLRDGLRDLGLSPTDVQVGQLLDYLSLISKWTKVYNLTAVRDPQEMLTHHLLDSLAAIPPLRRHTEGRAIRLLDVGSGAGLPGVVVAICCPEINVSCVATLKLPNLKGMHARVESLTGPFDVISSRAFASLADFVNWSGGALGQGGTWLAMKGKHPADEIAALPPSVQMFHVEQLTVPGLDAERCIVWLRQADDGAAASGVT